MLPSWGSVRDLPGDAPRRLGLEPRLAARSAGAGALGAARPPAGHRARGALRRVRRPSRGERARSQAGPGPHPRGFRPVARREPGAEFRRPVPRGRSAPHARASRCARSSPADPNSDVIEGIGTFEAPTTDPAGAWLRENAEALALVRRASVLPRSPIVPIDRQTLFSRPEPINFRGLALLVVVSHRERRERGDLAGAWEDLAVLLRMARHRSGPVPLRRGHRRLAHRTAGPRPGDELGGRLAPDLRATPRLAGGVPSTASPLLGCVGLDPGRSTPRRADPESTPGRTRREAPRE